MRFRLAITALALVSTPAFAAEVVPADFACIDKAINPAKFSMARGIVNASIPEDQGDQMVRQLIGSVMQTFRSSSSVEIDDPEIKAVLDRRFKEVPDRLLPILNRHMPQLYGSMACAYAREFTLPELTEINAFAQTPAGRRFLSQSQKLMGDPDVQQAFQAYMVDVQAMGRQFGSEVANEIIELKSKKKKK